MFLRDLAAMAAICIPALSQESKTPLVKHKVVFERNAPAPSGWDRYLMTIKLDIS